VRDAEEADVPALTAIKGDAGAALHRDRLRESQGSGFRYLVLQVDQEIIGFACLVFRRPSNWSDAGNTQHLPQIVDLLVNESHRGRGYGSTLVRTIEQIVAAKGYDQLFIDVEPFDNPRAYALYQRLGFQPLQSEPYLSSWKFTDSAGKDHHGEAWVVDLVKQYSK